MILLSATLKKESVRYIQRNRLMIFPSERDGFSKRRSKHREVSEGLYHLLFLWA